MKIFIRLVVVFSAIIYSVSASSATILGLSDPYGVTIDEKTGFIYVSNMNGDPTIKDDNGFISRLTGEGVVDNLKFIDGASNDVVLNAPKGMEVLGSYIYVCDIDKLSSFSTTNGKHLFDVNFGDLPVQYFYDLDVGPDGALYVTDAGTNRIYRIDVVKQHEVTLFAEGDVLGGPRGITWYPPRQNFIVTGGISGCITAYDKGGNNLQIPVVFLKSPAGIDIDDSGNMYVADMELGGVYKLGSDFALNSYQKGVSWPVGIVYSRISQNMIVTSLKENAVNFYPVNP